MNGGVYAMAVRQCLCLDEIIQALVPWCRWTTLPQSASLAFNGVLFAQLPSTPDRAVSRFISNVRKTSCPIEVEGPDPR
jgi:hypothetical protein